MKLKIFILIIFFFIRIALFAQTPPWAWAKSAGGISWNGANSVAADASGNSYITGYFDSPKITFGTTTLTNVGARNIFLVKYNSNGNVIWAKSAGGAGNDVGNSVSVDASGNICVTGYFYSSNIVFGSTTLTNNTGAENIFLAKYDTNGNVLWAKSIGGSGDEVANSVVVNISGNIFVTGYFDSDTINFGSIILTNAGTANIFLAKYDASGNVLWAESAGGINLDEATSVAVDASGNAFITGYFSNSNIIFGSDTLTNTTVGYYYNDIFLVKYDANGNVLWAKSAGGTNEDDALSVSVDFLGNAYVAGWFESSTITFDSIILANSNPVGSFDMFLAKYNANGNVLWAKSTGGSSMNEAYSVAVDISGNIYLTGVFMDGTIIFGSTILSITPGPGGNDMFLAKYNANGNILWAKSAGGTNDNEAYSVAVDGSGNAYVAGWFENSTIIFDTTTLSNSGNNNYDVFLAKIGQCAMNISLSHTGICSDVSDGTATAIVTGGASPYSYLWNTSPSQTTATAIGLKSGTYVVTITDTIGCVASKSVVISKNKPLPTITCDTSSLICNQAYSYYQWYLNSDSLSGGQYDSIYSPVTMSGNYHLVVTDSNGCNGTSNTINITITSIANSFIQNKIYIYPNPVSDNLQIQTTLPIKEIAITDITGRLLYTTTAKTINCSSFAKGVYFITLTTENGKAVKKFVKE